MSVPAEGRLHTFSCAPILSVRSRLPGRPQCPSRPERSTCGSISQPSSRITARKLLDQYCTSTSPLRARAWRNAFTRATRPTGYASSRIVGCSERDCPSTITRKVVSCGTGSSCGRWEIPVRDSMHLKPMSGDLEAPVFPLQPPAH